MEDSGLRATGCPILADQVRKVFEIPSTNWHSFVSKIDVLTAKALKLKCGAVGYRVLGQHIKTTKRQDTEENELATSLSTTSQRLVYEVEIFGSTPKLNGWTFVATLEHHEEQSETFTRALPGYDLPDKFRTATNRNCDHCHKDIWRKDTYVVLSETTGEYKQVGRTCLRDFLGHDNPESVARYSSLLFTIMELGSGEFDDEMFDGRCGRRCDASVTLLELLTVAVAVIKRYGWISRAKAKFENVTASADWVSLWMFDPKTARHMQDEDHFAIDADDSTVAARVIEWAEAVPPNTISDYLHNIKVLADSGLVFERQIGLAVSAVASYQRSVAEELESKAAGASTEWFGEIDKRLRDIAVTLLMKCSIEANEFGPRWLIKFKDEAGHTFVWFTGTCIDLNEGTAVLLTGTIKNHSEYKGAKETIVSRCKVVVPADMSNELVAQAATERT